MVVSARLASAGGGQGDGLAVGSGEADQVCCPALHLDGRERGAAGAEAGSLLYSVAEVVAQDRLDLVGQVGHQHLCRTVPLVVPVDGLR